MGTVVVGAGGFGREVLGVIDSMRDGPRRDVAPSFLGFVDDGEPDLALLVALGERVLGSIEVLVGLEADYVVAIGDPAVRRQVDDRLVAFGRSAAPPVIHALSAIGRDVQLGDGTVVLSGVTITTHVRIGRHVHLGVNVLVAHDCVLGDFVTVGPATTLCGNVSVGEGAELGAGSTVLPGVTIGTRAVVGAGAMVNKDVDAGITVVGVPARPR